MGEAASVKAGHRRRNRVVVVSVVVAWILRERLVKRLLRLLERWG